MRACGTYNPASCKNLRKDLFSTEIVEDFQPQQYPVADLLHVMLCNVCDPFVKLHFGHEYTSQYLLYKRTDFSQSVAISELDTVETMPTSAFEA